MSLDTYTNLKAAIADELVDTSITDSQIEDFITLAEARHRSEVRIRELLIRTNLSMSSRFTSLPTRFAGEYSLRLLTNPVTPLESVSMAEINENRSEGNGRPALYTTHVEIEVDIVPEETYDAEIIYYSYPLPLSDSNPSNEILARDPNLYLYGACLHAAPFLAHDERLPTWNQLYEGHLDALKLSSKKERRSGHMVQRLKGRRTP